MTAKQGQREVLAQLLVGGLSHRPGCLSYVVAEEVGTTDRLWVTEAWVDEAAHRASLRAPEIKVFTTRAWPMIATMTDSVVTTPVGGIGL